MPGIKIMDVKKKIEATKGAKEVLLEICFFALGLTLMPVRFLFGTYPFGIALLGAAGKGAPFVFAGAMISVLFFMEDKPLYAVSLVALLGLRVASSFIRKNELVKTELGERQGMRILKMLFCESVELKVAVASLVALGVGIYKVIYNGYLYYDVFVLVFNTVFVSILTFCLCGLLEPAKKRTFLSGLGALCFCVAFALKGVELGGISLSVVLSYGAVLYVSKCLGGVKGAVVGIVLGCAQGGVMGTLLGIGGLVAGYMWGISPYLAIMCAFVLCMGYGVSIMGYEAVAYLMPELLAASLIMYPILRFELLPKLPFLKKEESGMTIYRLRGREAEISAQIGSLSRAFLDVSHLVRSVAQKTKKPDRRGYYNMALEVCEGYCYACPKHVICWDKDMATTENNVRGMAEALFARQRVGKDDVEEKFLHRCPNIDTIMDDLNERERQIVANSVKSDKLEVCAQDYEGISKLIDTVSKAERELVTDKAQTDKARRICASMGLVCESVEVLRGAQRQVVATGVDIQRSSCTSEALRQALEKGLSVSLGEVEIEDGDGGATLKIRAGNSLRAECAFVTHAQSDKEANGDSYAAFESAGRQYVVVCDGMGSGSDARLTSKMCVELLQKMLSVSKEKEATLSLLNNLIRAKNTECSSTVDLFELDLMSGEGWFVKSGACPSFIKRGEKVYKLQSKTAPIGIMKKLDAEELAFSLNKGDICVMVSDGVTPSKQDSQWLMQYLTQYKGDDDPQALAEAIIKEAKRHGVRDDMTVAATVIS